MPTNWLKRIKATGKLKVYNSATLWATAVADAIATFNNQKFGLTFVAVKDIKEADVVIKLSLGPDSYQHYGDKATTGPKFDPKQLHGQCSTFTDKKEKKKIFEVFFAAIFLPGQVKVTSGQKEMLVLHELIHACGLDGGMENGDKSPNQDHETEGIMCGTMQVDGTGMIEAMRIQGAKPMPPVRWGTQTPGKIRGLWPKKEEQKSE